MSLVRGLKKSFTFNTTLLVRGPKVYVSGWLSNMKLEASTSATGGLHCSSCVFQAIFHPKIGFPSLFEKQEGPFEAPRLGFRPQPLPWRGTHGASVLCPKCLINHAFPCKKDLQGGRSAGWLSPPALGQTSNRCVLLIVCLLTAPRSPHMGMLVTCGPQGGNHSNSRRFPSCPCEAATSQEGCAKMSVGSAGQIKRHKQPRCFSSPGTQNVLPGDARIRVGAPVSSCLSPPPLPSLSS